MTFSSSCLLFTRFLIILQLLWSGSFYANGCYTSIISFGDSHTDTGNAKYMASISHKFYEFLQPPYGETFFQQPTGRCSNGRLIIDFLAESLGLPLIPPFLHDNGSLNMGQGVNYAMVGATALDPSFHEARGCVNSVGNASLGVQLAWFKQSLPFICRNVSDCRKLIGRSLILMGEIGANDYGLPLFKSKPIEEVESYVSLVINAIVSTLNELIDMGAQTLVVPGTFPLGCSSKYLTIFETENKQEYDNTTGCLLRFNKLFKYHNELLQMKLNLLRELHPNVIIIYADYYNAAMQIIRSPLTFGFKNGVLKSCCGGGGPYNYNPLVLCGEAICTVCDDPDSYAFWDGNHFTEAGCRIISESLFQGSYTTPRFKMLCPTSLSQVGSGLSSSI